MSYIRILFTIALAILISSCTTILKTAYGFKKPRLETLASIHSFEHKNGLDSTKTSVFKDFRSFVLASQQGFITIPDAIFFNREGEFVSYNKTAKDCNADIDSFITDLETFHTYPVDPNIKLSDFTQLVSIPDHVELDIADINVFITWTIYVGKLNEDKAFEWIKLLENARANGANINYFLLNCDYQKSWNLPIEVQKKLGIKS